jgi:pyruvate-ferredoxin/flavodoxin oxidoreductase
MIVRTGGKSRWHMAFGRRDAVSRKILDGNEAAASVAYRLSEVIAIYPITPSSAMGELSDEWSSEGRKNVWGSVPRVIEMQSEGGAAGAVHGAVQAGALATTFTASQGLLLMIPNMFKMAGELTPFCMHVAARTVATHALSIFGDHSDVMACRQTGFAFLASCSVQEAHDMALAAHAASLESRVPFLHFFDGFRTSHEVTRIDVLSDEQILSVVDAGSVQEHRKRALSPDHPVLRGSAQNPDVFFQAREASNRFHDNAPLIVKDVFDKLAQATGRVYRLFEYHGHPEAERVIVAMGSAIETITETVAFLERQGEKVGVVNVRLYRPFRVAEFLDALPRSVRRIAVLDRTKEPGAPGEPLYLDVRAALAESGTVPEWSQERHVNVIGGRYGLSSKEFTPAMVKAVFDELATDHPRQRFTVGIDDDVTHLSLATDPEFDIEPPDSSRAIFFGLGSDGTVGANKNTVKIVGEGTDLWPQGYFVYDSKKSGTMTVSHLRFAKAPIRAPYLVRRATFVACHQYGFLDRHDILGSAAPGATFLLNAPFPAGDVWDHLPAEVQSTIIEKKLRFFIIDAYRLAREVGLGGRINTIMQACFLELSGVLPSDVAREFLTRAIEKSYSRRGRDIVEKNAAVVRLALDRLEEVEVPERVTAVRRQPPVVSENAPLFVRQVISEMLAGRGESLPVSAFLPDGTWPTGTARWEKRNIALEIPVWNEEICIQCNKCAFVCPHAAIRTRIYPPDRLEAAPGTFKAVEFRSTDLKSYKYTVQTAPEDCTGCLLCVNVCPAHDKSDPARKALEMRPQAPLLEAERANYDFFLKLPELDRELVKMDLKGSQLATPLFEYSGACSGCGETPYLKLLSQLYGDRALIANATGCSSIYGGNLPTTPYCTNEEGRGPAWANSLFEDNAEFGLGMRLAVDKQAEAARELLVSLEPEIGADLVNAIMNSRQDTDSAISAQRGRVSLLREKLRTLHSEEARRLETLVDTLVRKTVWMVGGDGWAYDIGFGGLDHVLSGNADVNVLVLDTEVYSNTGGQQSKATPLGAAARFAAAGKATAKKDLALMAMVYGHVYVARVAFGARDAHTVKVFQEAESYPGPSLIIAYSHCIAHGYDLSDGLEQQKLAVDTGYWPLFRYDPRLAGGATGPLRIDSPPPREKLSRYFEKEARFQSVKLQNPERYEHLLAEAQAGITRRYDIYSRLAEMLKTRPHDTETAIRSAVRENLEAPASP